MLTSNRGFTAAAIFSSFAIFSQPALAGDETDPPSAIEVSGETTLTSDYRFRGVSLSGGDFAVQGGISLDHESGIYVGTWASSIDDGGTGAFGDAELDIYGGWKGNLAEGIELDVGLLYYIYPTEDLNLDTDYFEPYATISGTIGPVEASVGVAYAWDQNALGGDNLYLSGDLSSGIPGTPVTLDAHLGYTDGQLAPPFLAGSTDQTGFDYGFGASVALPQNLEFRVGYVGVDGPSLDSFTDDTVVATLSLSF